MYERILIVVSSATTSRAAIKEGVALAKVHDAEVTFFSVLPRYVLPVMDIPLAIASSPAVDMPSPDAFRREARSNAERLLAAATAVADKAGVRSRYAMGTGNDDALCVIGAARKRRCGLIVVASAGRGALVRLLSGSVIPGLITHSTLPVLVCRHASRSEKAERAPRPARPGAKATGRVRRRAA